jgi:hypothetical protein
MVFLVAESLRAEAAGGFRLLMMISASRPGGKEITGDGAARLRRKMDNP